METVDAQIADRLRTKVDQLSQLIADKIGPRGPDLGRQVRKAGRRLPASIRRDVLQVVKAAAMAQQPKLARQISQSATSAAFDRAAEHLKSIDKADRRRGIMLAWLGQNAMNMLIVIGAVIVVLRLRGLI